MGKSKQDRLPNKLSETILLGLRNFGKCEKSNKYRIEMGTWHTYAWDKFCYVCLAGAVMAQTLGVAPEHTCFPYSLPEPSKLRALDYARSGEWSTALKFFRHPGEAPEGLPIPVNYHVDPKAFKRDMRRAVKILREAGL